MRTYHDISQERNGPNYFHSHHMCVSCVLPRVGTWLCAQQVEGAVGSHRNTDREQGTPLEAEHEMLFLSSSPILKCVNISY